MSRFLKAVGVGVGVLLAASALSSCSSDGLGLDADGSYFKGLDPVVVNEVLDAPSSREVLQGMERPALEDTAQAMVLTRIYCRDGYRAYLEWIATGVTPTLAPVVVPSNPGDVYQDVVDIYFPQMAVTLESGDPEALRQFLTDPNGTCGSTTPVIPGDVDGPTIGEVLAGLAPSPPPQS